MHRITAAHQYVCNTQVADALVEVTASVIEAIHRLANCRIRISMDRRSLISFAKDFSLARQLRLSLAKSRD